MKKIFLMMILGLVFQACSCDEKNGGEDGDAEEEDVLTDDGAEADQEGHDPGEVDQEAVEEIETVDQADAEDVEEEEVVADCGNGIVEAGEACDEGDDNSDTEPDACRTTCELFSCGDGVLDTGEGCDDGNDVDDDGCTNGCALPTCGNGDVEFGEACDDGNDDNSDACLSTCVAASCGDGYVHAEVEECDDRNRVEDDGCTPACVFSCHLDRDCDDRNVCTDDTCDIGGTGMLCASTDNTAACSDGDPCTDPDACSGGSCVPGADVCECETDDDCLPFEDDDLCNGTYVCAADNFCAIDPGTIVTCDASGDTDCRKNLCGPATGECAMTDMPDGDPCADADPCNDPDACDGAGACEGTDTGLTDCGGECVDLDTDHDNCGTCFFACAFDEDCVDGDCTVHRWTPVGGGLADPIDNVLAQAIATDGTEPFVSMILADAGATKPVITLRYTGGTWAGVPGMSSGAEATDPRTIDLDFNGTRPTMIFPHVRTMVVPPSTVRLVRCEGDLATCSDEYYQTACMMNFSVAMDLSGADPHFTTVGAGGCGIGIGYAWYDAAGDVFHEHPGEGIGDGTLPWEANGKSSVVVTRTPYVGVLAHDYAADPPNFVYVAYYDTAATGWTVLDGDLAVHQGECMGAVSPGDSPCAISVTSDAVGTLYAAWTENRDPNTRLVYVKRHDTTGWTLLGGPLNDPLAGGFGNGGKPVITITRGEIFVAYQDFAGTNWQVFVKHWNGTAWESVGPALNVDPARAAVSPDITSIGAVLYVSFLENVAVTSYNVFVKSFP